VSGLLQGRDVEVEQSCKLSCKERKNNYPANDGRSKMKYAAIEEVSSVPWPAISSPMCRDLCSALTKTFALDISRAGGPRVVFGFVGLYRN